MNRSRRQVLKVGCGLLAAAKSRSAEPVLGMIIPGTGDLPTEAISMYPAGVRFVTEGLSKPGDGPLIGTIATYEKLQDRIVPAAEALAKEGAQGILLLGTSVTFYRGVAHNQGLTDSIHKQTGLPATTMTSAMVDGLRAVGGKRVAVASGYTEEVNERLRVFFEEAGFEVLAIKGLGMIRPPDNLSRDELGKFVAGVFERAPKSDALAMAFASLGTLELIAPLERRCKVPVISARPHAFRAGVRLLGLTGTVRGFGTLLSKS